MRVTFLISVIEIHSIPALSKSCSENYTQFYVQVAIFNTQDIYLITTACIQLNVSICTCIRSESDVMIQKLAPLHRHVREPFGSGQAGRLLVRSV